MAFDPRPLVQAAEKASTQERWDYVEGKTLLHVETHCDDPQGGGRPVCSIPKKRRADASHIAYANPAAIIAWGAAHAAQAAEVERLREALRFYADVSKYPAPLTGGMGDLWRDCGSIARTALAGDRADG